MSDNKFISFIFIVFVTYGIIRPVAYFWRLISGFFIRYYCKNKSQASLLDIYGISMRHLAKFKSEEKFASIFLYYLKVDTVRHTEISYMNEIFNVLYLYLYRNLYFLVI